MATGAQHQLDCEACDLLSKAILTWGFIHINRHICITVQAVVTVEVSL